jgi:hypothetical protein
VEFLLHNGELLFDIESSFVFLCRFFLFAKVVDTVDRRKALFVAGVEGTNQICFDTFSSSADTLLGLELVL